MSALIAATKEIIVCNCRAIGLVFKLLVVKPMPAFRNCSTSAGKRADLLLQFLGRFGAELLSSRAAGLGWLYQKAPAGLKSAGANSNVFYSESNCVNRQIPKE